MALASLVLLPVASAVSSPSFFYLRVSNAGDTTWRPGVTDLALYSNTACTATVGIPAEGGWNNAASACASNGCELCSGWDNHFGNLQNKGCHRAIDGDSSTSWRPHGTNRHQTIWAAGSIWIMIRFSSDPGVACVKATNLGQGGDPLKKNRAFPT